MKKIMFNDKYGLTKAVLEGRKTMTRRIIGDYKTIITWRVLPSGPSFLAYPEDGDTIKVSPQYMEGEVVAVAMAYKNISDKLGAMARCMINPFGSPKDHPGWNNKMFVATALMPYDINIVNIKAERLQDISDEDCMREGIMEGEFMNTWNKYYYDVWGDVPNHITFKTPREAFASLIDRISGKGTWERNPWCFAYTFELIK